MDKEVWGVFFQISNRGHPTEGGIYEALLYNVPAGCKELVTVFLDFKFYKQLRSSYHQVRYAFKWDFDMRLNLIKSDINLEMKDVPFVFSSDGLHVFTKWTRVAGPVFLYHLPLPYYIYNINILHQGFGAKHISATGAVTAMFATAALRDIFWGEMRCHLVRFPDPLV